MDEIEVTKVNTRNLKIRKVVYYILGILEVLFTFRLIMKLLGANPENLFISIIYNVTYVLLFPFISIFRTATTTGIETRSILEPGTIIGMIVYALVALAIVKIVRINKVSSGS